jgi:phosphocarrier protein HPr
MSEHVRRLPIVNQRGLHARASRKFAELVLAYEATVVVRRDGEQADGTSLMDLMMLGAGPGCEIEVAATGLQAREVLDALTKLVADKFGEGE